VKHETIKETKNQKPDDTSTWANPCSSWILVVLRESSEYGIERQVGCNQAVN
jgi:hypothetical protein